MRYNCALCPDHSTMSVDPCFQLWHSHQQGQTSISSSESRSNQTNCENESASDSADTESEA